MLESKERWQWLKGSEKRIESFYAILNEYKAMPVKIDFEQNVIFGNGKEMEFFEYFDLYHDYIRGKIDEPKLRESLDKYLVGL